MTRDHTQWEELAVGHAFSALEPEDEEKFLVHLRGCAICERTLAETNALASHLAYAAEPVEPPPALHDAIMAAVRESDRQPSFPTQVPPLRAASPVRHATTSADRSRRWRSSTPSSAVFGLAASLAAVVALGVWNTNLRANVEVKNAAIARMEQMGAVAADPATVRVPLSSSSGAHGSALVRGNDAYVLLAGLPINSPSSVYVLWYQDHQGGFHAIDTFDVVEDGHVNLVEAKFDRTIDRIAAVAVSREPGRTAPPTPSFALVKGITATA